MRRPSRQAVEPLQFGPADHAPRRRPGDRDAIVQLLPDPDGPRARLGREREPTDAAQELCRPSLRRHRTHRHPRRAAPSGPVLETRPDRRDLQRPRPAGNHPEPAHEDVRLAHHRTDPADADRLQLVADQPDVGPGDRGRVDLGPLPPADHPHPSSNPARRNGRRRPPRPRPASRRSRVPAPPPPRSSARSSPGPESDRSDRDARCVLERLSHALPTTYATGSYTSPTRSRAP